MGWQLPSLAALRTFEAAARHMSFTKAAAELNLTQSAVSRHIRGIEEYLGVLLFERIKQKLELTDAGRSYAKDIRTALDQMQLATVNLVAHRGQGGILNLATPPAFGLKWLIPRLDKFGRTHPDILINLATHLDAKPFNFDNEQLDAAIHYGNNDWPDVLFDPLIGEEITLACSPGYLAKNPPLAKPQDLAHHVLLQSTRRPNMWRDWLQGKDAEGINVWGGLRFEAFYMIMQAAVAGLGVALLPRLLIQEDVHLRRLVIPMPENFVSRNAYCLVYPKSKRNNPKLHAFRTWILSEAVMAKRNQVAC